MKRAFFLMLIVPCIYGLSEQKPIDEQIEQKPVVSQIPAVNISVAPLSKEQTEVGLTEQDLQGILSQALSEANIPIDEQLQQPKLVLKIRSIQVGLDVATFFHLSLQEQSMLVRNRALFNATTWSQTALLSCPPDRLKDEVVETIAVMVQNFTKEYVQALKKV